MDPGVPEVVLGPRGAARARAGHPWIFRSDVETEGLGPEAGAEIRAVDARRNLLGRGFWARNSPIAVRLLTRADVPLDAAFLRARLSQALSRRKVLYPGADAFRMVHGEADLLPGYFVDLYGDSAAVQHLAEWAEARSELLAGIVAEVSGARAVVARDDGSSRDFEGLPRRVSQLRGSAPVVQRYHEGDLELEVDLLADHKTGGYLDQRENHLRAGELARGDALDAFCYHGGFALQLARKAKTVLALDQDPAAVARTRENARRNGIENLEARAANAIEQLRALEREGRRFDVVVLDPPAFAKRREGLEGALRAYREINYRGVRLLAPGVLLVTCSCSGKVTPEIFGEVIEWAARDHPTLVGVPETDYLKAWFLIAPP